MENSNGNPDSVKSWAGRNHAGSYTVCRVMTVPMNMYTVELALATALAMLYHSAERQTD